MSKKELSLSLPAIPKGELYEDYVAAILSVCGLFLERRINLSEPVNILELDIVTTKFSQDKTEKTLAEIKSGDWGLPDVFKVRGWLDYLRYPQASFIVLDNKKQTFVECQNIASSLQIDLLNIPKAVNGNLDATELLNHFGISSIDKKIYECSIPTLRYAYCMERMMIEKYLKPLAKDTNELEGYRKLETYIHEIRDYSFFENDVHQRLLKVFSSFQEFFHITARIDKEKETGIYDEEYDNGVTEATFKMLNYEIPAKQTPLHVALYAEMFNRLIMFKLVVEESITDRDLKGLVRTLKRLSLPSNIKTGIDKLVAYPHYYLYPVLWQNFIFVLGGFLLKDKLEEEYHVLSVLSGVPEDEVESALGAYDLLFPLTDGSWLFDKPNTSIRILKFMPLPFCGLGANFRRLYYRFEDKNTDYSYLNEVLSGTYTVGDLIKYNNLAIEYLSKAKELVVN